VLTLRPIASPIASLILGAVLALALAALPAPAADLLVSEFMAANRTVLLDEDGEASDWAEIHNPSPDAVDLDAWHLTDDAGDLRKWRFPAVVIEGGGYLVVFCSGKDRALPGAELHASFALAADGEFLALVRPDGTPSHAYSPRFRAQRADFSFGIGRDLIVEPLVAEGAPLKVLVPADGALGSSWTGGAEPFADSAWTVGAAGAGYLVSYPGFAVTTYIATLGVSSLAIAEQVASSPSLQAQVHAENLELIDLYNTGGTGHYGGNQPFPGTTVGDDVNNFVVVARAVVMIPAAGAWTFGVSSDDGFGLDLEGAGASFRIEYPAPRGPGDTLGVFNAPEAGPYDLRLVMYEQGGGAEVELFAAPGSRASWDSTFRLVGDTVAGGLAAESQPVASGSLSTIRTLIRTDLETAMRGVSSSAYVRVPFEVADPARYGSLFLRMKYDDGFVAYLNGVEVARRNAPPAPGHDARATADRPALQASGYQDIDISSRLGLLASGPNVLAIHGLNDDPLSGDFLILPELAEITTVSMAEGFFDEPTPGAENGTLFTDFVADTQFSTDRGFHDAPFTVEVTTATPGAAVRYTTDGSAPTETNGITYTGPVPVSGTTTLRAAAFKPGFLPTNVDTHTYIFLADVLTQTGAGFPPTWGAVAANYEMDPEVVNDPRYRDEIREDLLSLPSVSIVMQIDDLFGASRGIYANSQASGVAWERPGSVELILPEGMEGPAGDGRGFAIHCGVRMHGGVGRSPSVPKHSFRFLFKGAYGPTKLDYPLFGDDAAEEFDTLILRAGFNNTWVFNSPGEMRQAQYLRDQWMRDAGLALGQPQPHGIYVHLYVNGLYWGLYNFVERPSAPFAAAYFGGEKEEWDVLNSSEPVDGSKDAWNTLQALADAGVATPEAYAAIQEYLDVPNLIDYMIFNFYGGNSDWDGHNWYAGRRRAPGAGYKFFSWDAERSLEGLGSDRTGLNAADKPSRLYSQLRANEEFRVLWGDHSHRHFFNGGPLSPEACGERYERLAASIERGIVGESARWGDTHREPPFTRDVEWTAERDRLLASYCPQRTQVMVSQFRAAGLYPTVDAPRFSRHGGRIEPGFELIATAPEGTIYYTLDGSDPRLEGGAVSSQALVAGTVTATTLVPEGGAVRVRVPADGSLGLEWTLPGFDDAGWLAGTTGVGFERSSGYEALIGTDVGALMGTATASVYLRQTFEIAAPAAIALLELRMRYDDGFIAYLNGVPIAARNAPAAPAWNATAAASHADGEAVIFETIDIAGAALHLVEGTNVLAVHGLNVSTGSSDLLITPELRAVEATGQGIPLDRAVTVKSRARLDGEWSALHQAFFHFDLPLRVTELMYHPRPPAEESALDADLFEYIELQNIGDTPLDLSGFRLAGGVDYDFSTGVTQLGPGEVILVVKDLAAFVERYPFLGAAIAGEYSRQLGNSGDRVLLAGPAGEPILDFLFSDIWYPETDGEGHSLVVTGTGHLPEAWGEASSWTLSPDLDGSPGFVESGPLPAGGRQLRGNLNQDAAIDIADAFRLLRHLFLAAATPLPCDGASVDEGGNRLLADVDGTGAVDLTDALGLLNYLFLAGPSLEIGAGCVRIPGCPSACPF
jgi:hypothetical protein